LGVLDVKGNEQRQILLPLGKSMSVLATAYNAKLSRLGRNVAGNSDSNEIMSFVPISDSEGISKKHALIGE
jgi:hypothetical protein